MNRRRRRPPGRLRISCEAITTFYRRPVAWAALLVSALLLTFGGGAVMFWFHAILRGERGPAIGDVHHWLLDSSLGLVGLTPVLALILPVGVRMVAASSRLGTGAYVATVAVLFTLTTGPGPFLHNLVAGADTPLARLATVLFGRDPSVAARTMHVDDRSPVVEGLLQVGLGLPVYLFCTWLALHLVRGFVRRSRRGIGPEAATAPDTDRPSPTGVAGRQRSEPRELVLVLATRTTSADDLPEAGGGPSD